MALVISIEELEAAINRARRAAPPVNGVLSPDLRTLAELYGTMIYARAKSVDLDQQTETIRDTAVRWFETPKPVTQPSSDAALGACAYQPGAASCDACQ